MKFRRSVGGLIADQSELLLRLSANNLDRVRKANLNRTSPSIFRVLEAWTVASQAKIRGESNEKALWDAHSYINFGRASYVFSGPIKSLHSGAEPELGDEGFFSRLFGLADPSPVSANEHRAENSLLAAAVRIAADAPEKAWLIFEKYAAGADPYVRYLARLALSDLAPRPESSATA